MRQLIQKELSYKLIGLFYKVHKELGRFCRERQYGDLLEKYIQEVNIPYQREIEISEGNRVDFQIEKKILIDIKAKPFITKEDYRQMQRYLQSTQIVLGMIINFRNFYLKPKRILNTKLFHSEHPVRQPADRILRIAYEN